MPVTQVKSKQQFSITADLDFASAYRGINLLDPINPQDAATKNYVDALKQALDIKDSVRAATTANITLSGTQTIDGVAVVVGDRVLVKDQTAGQDNGIYIVGTVAWTRSSDANASSEVTAGMFTFVEEGTINGDSGWVLTTNGTITLGTTPLTFSQFSGAGQITAGAGLTKTGNTIDIGTASTARIVVNTDNIDLATTGVSAASYGNTGFNVPNIAVDAYGRITTAANRDLFGSALTANTVFAAPNGAAGAPSFRLLVAADIPNLDAGKITTGTLAIARGGTGLATTPTNGQLLIGNGTGYTLATITGTANRLDVTNGAGSITLNISASYVGQNTITTLGTITTGVWNGTAIAAANGGTGQTTYVIGDILYASATNALSRLAGVATGNALISGGVGAAPSWGKIGLTTHVSGTLAIGNGGTGLATTPTNGQLLIGNGTGYTLAALTQGTGISVTNGTGSITIAINSTDVVLAANYVVRESPTGTIDGTNATFTLAATPLAGKEEVYVNGILQNSGTGNDYTISGATITFLSGAIPQSGDVIRVTYLK